MRLSSVYLKSLVECMLQYVMIRPSLVPRSRRVGTLFPTLRGLGTKLNYICCLITYVVSCCNEATFLSYYASKPQQQSTYALTLFKYETKVKGKKTIVGKYSLQ